MINYSDYSINSERYFHNLRFIKFLFIIKSFIFNNKMEKGISKSQILETEKLRPSDKLTNIFSGTGVGCILVAIYFLGYLYTSQNKNPNAFVQNAEKGYNDYSVSNAVGNGQKEAISGLVVLMTILVTMLIYKRRGKFFIARLVLFPILGILLILVVYVNPLRLELKNRESYTDAHAAIAVLAFLLNSVFIGLTYHCFKITYQPNLEWYKSYFYYLTILNVLFFVFCIFSILMDKKEHKNGKWNAAGHYSYSFAIFENLQVASIITVILFLGFFKEEKYKIPSDNSTLIR